MKNKGFTLIELLAVIVILAIIALIAVPVILGVVERARKGAATSSALGYIEAVEKQMMINELSSTNTKIETGVYDAPMASEYGVKVKGSEPKSGWLEITNNQVSRYSLIIGKYVVSYDGTTKTTVKSDTANKKPNNTSANRTTLSQVIKVGDYVKMTPTQTSFVISPKLTDSTKGDQTIYPSLLNLWRVLKINNDGTIDMISEYVTDEIISFDGYDEDYYNSGMNRKAFENYIYIMKIIANSFQNDKYTISARIPGYNGQIEKLNSSNIKYDQLIWKCSTDDENCNTIEANGGGDTKYKDDLELIKNVYGNYNADFLTPRSVQAYYIASRKYAYGEYSTTNSSRVYTAYSARMVYKKSSQTEAKLSSSTMYTHVFEQSGGGGSVTHLGGIRPIVTLKSEISIPSGDGQSIETAWNLE